MSSEQNGAAPALREQILSDPAVILDDPDVMRALVDATDAAHEGRVVDMRGAAMARLETRIGRIETAHQSVIEAAYDNVATTQQVHRALLTMLLPLEFDTFLDTLDTSVADCLRLRAIRLVLSAETDDPDCDLNPISGTLTVLPARSVAAFRARDGAQRTRPLAVALRPVASGDPLVYGTAAGDIRSEAIVELDLGRDRAPGLLVLGAEEPGHFAPGQATDLLELFARTCERLMRGWLG